MTNPEAGMKNVGNSIDVYCFALTQIVEFEEEATVASGEATITAKYLQDIIEVRETLSGVALPLTDYSVLNEAKSLSFSGDNSIKLLLPELYEGASLTIRGLRWLGESTDAYLSSPSVRYPVVSLMAKAYPLAIVKIDYLQYSGNLNIDVAKALIMDYINSIKDKVLDKSDLIGVLYKGGATAVNLSMVITVKEYDQNYYYSTTTMENSYTLNNSSIKRFYTNLEFLEGVIRN